VGGDGVRKEGWLEGRGLAGVLKEGKREEGRGKREEGDERLSGLWRGLLSGTLCSAAMLAPCAALYQLDREIHCISSQR
jgi:hypothetical protein